MKNRISVTSLSCTFFVFLFILSIVFREERILFLDNALQTFLLINTQELEVMAMRYPAVVVRLLPLLGVKLNMSLSWIVALFSISYILWQSSLLWLGSKWLKNKWWLVAMCLSLSLVLGHSFFWCNSELLFAVPSSVIVLGFILQKIEDDKFTGAIVIALLGSIILVFYHPQSLFVLFIGLLFLIPFEKKSWKLYTFPLLVAGILLLKSLLIKNWYDTMKFEELRTNVASIFPRIFSTDSFSHFLGYLSDMLLLPFVVFLATSVYLLIKRRWYKFFVLVSGSLFILTLFHLANVHEMTLYYAEAGYSVWSGLVAVAFTFEVLRELSSQKLVYTGLLLICITKIICVSPFYEDRVDFVESLCIEYEGDKVLIPGHTLPDNLFMLRWGLPFETVLLSHLRTDIEGTVLVPTSSSDNYIEYENGSEFINGMGSAIDISIDTTYFSNIRGPYRRVSAD